MNPAAAVDRFIGRYRMKQGTVVVACSGGADSMALLHLLHASAADLRLLVAHVNHGLRGDASDADEAWVEATARQMGLAYAATRLELKPEQPGLEAAARIHRYTWLRHLAHENNARWIATAHHADDQAETVLHHFLRGSHWRGLRGLAARRRCGEVLIMRPLLRIPKSALLRYLRERCVDWREDASNADPRFTRNFLRQDILRPLAERFGTRPRRALLWLARQARTQTRMLHREAKALLARTELQRVGTTLVLRTEGLADQPRAVVAEMLVRIWRREGWPRGQFNRRHWRSAADIVRSGKGTVDLPGGIRLRAHRKVIQIQPS